jgi:RNA polymerase sigma-70 factor (ECF subfamily)
MLSGFATLFDQGMRNSSTKAARLAAHQPANQQCVPDELCERALRGDDEAWNRLIAIHNRRVVLTLLARGVRIDLAREFAQEAWMRLVDRQRQGKLEMLKLPGLAIAQALFLARDDARRSRVIRPHLRLDECEANLHDDPSAALAGRDRLRRARAILEGASPRAQQIFALLYSQPGIRHDEIARRVDLSVQRVRQTICEVRKQLRAALDEK